jgi:hypothetical protein
MKAAGMLNIYVSSPEDMEIKMKQFAGLLFNLRNATKAADQSPTPDTYATKTFWEQRADEVLKEIEGEAQERNSSHKN